MTDPAARSGELFESGYMCAESVLTALCEHRGVESELIPRVASGFCAGIGRTSGLCGAVAGAVMALGVFQGRNVPEDDKERIFTLTAHLLAEFKKKFGSCNCTELLGCDLGTVEGREAFAAKEMRKNTCVPLTRAATEIALTLLEKES
jgi:C_GCAxxG_C_C family probable redox protein